MLSLHSIPIGQNPIATRASGQIDQRLTRSLDAAGSLYRDSLGASIPCFDSDISIKVENHNSHST